jgi:hypothetical protein
MRREEFQLWYDQLLQRGRSLPIGSVPGITAQEGPARQWATEAESALAAVFPDGHATRQGWARVLKTPRAQDICVVTEALVAIFEAAATLIRDNRLNSLIDAIRIESESELLDQALILANAHHRAAAAVIAGGALETHLRHYVDKHRIPITGAGTISKYNSAIGEARKPNPLLYSANDARLVEAWGGYRNEAAHTPGEFARTKEDVKRMIEGIREFIARTA